MDEDGEISTTADPLGELYDSFEKEHHEVIAFLVENNYPADDMKLFIRRVTANQTRGRAAAITLPNTRERQDLLMEVSSARRTLF